MAPKKVIFHEKRKELMLPTNTNDVEMSKRIFAGQQERK